jgi:hypothetical protein
VIQIVPVLCKGTELEPSSQASKLDHRQSLHFCILGGIESAQSMHFNVHRPERKVGFTTRGRQSRTVHNDLLFIHSAGRRRWSFKHLQPAHHRPSIEPIIATVLVPSDTTSKPRLDVRRPVGESHFALVVRPSFEQSRHLVPTHPSHHRRWKLARIEEAGRPITKTLRSKIKGRGTCARLRFCLHIRFLGTHLGWCGAGRSLTPSAH